MKFLAFELALYKMSILRNFMSMNHVAMSNFVYDINEPNS